MWIRNKTKWFRKPTELTKTSSRVQATSVLTGSAVSTNCAQSFSISPQLPHIFSASTKQGTFVKIGKWGSTTPSSSVIKSSANGCSRWRTTRGLFVIFSIWRSRSSALNGFPWETQNALPRCFQTQALITSKVTIALEVPQHFMMSMCEHRHNLPAHPTVKMVWHIGSVWWSCHKEPAKLGCRVHLLHAESLFG